MRLALISCGFLLLAGAEQLESSDCEVDDSSLLAVRRVQDLKKVKCTDRTATLYPNSGVFQQGYTGGQAGTSGTKSNVLIFTNYSVTPEYDNNYIHIKGYDSCEVGMAGITKFSYFLEFTENYFVFHANRYRAGQPGDYFRDGLKSDNMLGLNVKEGGSFRELNFALKGDLLVNVFNKKRSGAFAPTVTLLGTLTCPDFRFAQGSDNWWIGGSNCKKVPPEVLRCNCRKSISGKTEKLFFTSNHGGRGNEFLVSSSSNPSR